jgi:gluconate 5-dehydrogenase
MSIVDRFRLDGKRALVTGATGGLARVICAALVEMGSDIVITSRDAKRLEALAADLKVHGHQVDAVPGDVSTPQGAEQLCDRVIQRKQAVDILINAVGGRVEPATDSFAAWQRVIDLNLTSAAITCRRIGEEMAKRGSGSILNVASIAGYLVIRNVSGRGYEVAKAGMLALTRCLAADWAGRGVRVNAIVPGGFLTERIRLGFESNPAWARVFLDHIPMGRLGDPAEIGPVAVFLASEASSYITGSSIVIDGGYTLW